MKHENDYLPRDLSINPAEWPEDLLKIEFPLHLLSKRTSNTLRRAELTSIEDYLTTDWQKFYARGFGESGRAELQKYQDQMGRTPDSVVQWLNEFVVSSPAIEYDDEGEIIAASFSPAWYPKDEDLDFTDEHIVILPTLLPELVRVIVAQDERSWGIFVRREELAEHRIYTLEDLRLFYNISRERVRQIQAESLKRLSNFMIGGSLCSIPEKIHPLVKTELDQLSALLHQQQYPLPDSAIWTQLNQRYGVPIEPETQRYFSILFELRGLFPHFINSSNSSERPLKIWLNNQAQKQSIESALQTTAAILRLRATAVGTFDLLIAVNRALERQNIVGMALSERELQRLLRLHSGLEAIAEDSYQIKFEELATNELRAERILRENADQNKLSMSTAELVSETNYRYAKAGRKAEATAGVISRACAASANIVNIGSAGGWTLKHVSEQNKIETRDIHVIIEEALRLSRQPLSLREIYDHVAALRPTSKQTVNTMMALHPETFARHKHGVWALCEWNLPKAAPVKRGAQYQRIFDDALIEIFSESESTPLALADLVRKLCQILNWKEISIRNYIKNSVRLDIEKISRAKSLVSLRDAPLPVAAPRPRDSKRGRVQLLARELLNAAQGTMAGPLLVAKIEKSTQYHPSLIYNSLSVMSDVEKVGASAPFTYRLLANKGE